MTFVTDSLQLARKTCNFAPKQLSVARSPVNAGPNGGRHMAHDTARQSESAGHAHVKWMCAIALLAPTLVEGGAPLTPVLTVRVFNAAQLGAQDLTRAERTATAVFERVDMITRWRSCASAAESQGAPPACTQSLAPGEVIVRLLGDTPSRDGDPWSLGHSYVDTEARAGVLATVFVNRVTATARRVRADRATLLGRAIAHEIGHLLFGTTAHSSTGLMRARWSDGDLVRAFNWGWWFSSREGAALRRGLARRWPVDTVIAKLATADPASIVASEEGITP
jgi:hypothetical protein